MNYVLHYPKERKYISLFPPEVRQGGKDKDAGDEEEGGGEGKSETDRQREEIRREIRERMDAGELSWEPEVELKRGEGKGGKAAPARSQDGAGKKAKSKESKAEVQKPAKSGGVAGDDFFAMDEDDEEEDDEEDEDSEMDED